MKIDIPDDTAPADRKQLLQLLPIKYALELCGSKMGAAAFLAMSPKTILSIVRKHPDFFGVKLTGTTHIHARFHAKVMELSKENQSKFWRYFEEYKARPGYRYAGPAEKNRIRNIALNKFLDLVKGNNVEAT